jgi:hypothetical protein
MMSDELKKANGLCITGMIICLGISFFWLIPIIRYGFLHYIPLWLPSLIAGVLSIVGIVRARNWRVSGFTLCIVTGIVALIFEIIFGFILIGILFGNAYLYVFNILGPIFIIAGGRIGIKS